MAGQQHTTAVVWGNDSSLVPPRALHSPGEAKCWGTLRGQSGQARRPQLHPVTYMPYALHRYTSVTWCWACSMLWMQCGAHSLTILGSSHLGVSETLHPELEFFEVHSNTAIPARQCRAGVSDACPTFKSHVHCTISILVDHMCEDHGCQHVCHTGLQC